MSDAALTRRFLELRNDLLAYLVALAGDPAVAEEAFQETGLTVLREAARGTVPADPDAWLRGVARNRLADHYRAESRRNAPVQSLDALAEIVAVACREHPIETIEPAEVERLRTCLDRLAPKARAIIDARYRDGRDLGAIATAVGWTIGAVKVALSRARKSLGVCLHRARAQEGGA